jgi:hypothetical protein
MVTSLKNYSVLSHLFRRRIDFKIKLEFNGMIVSKFITGNAEYTCIRDFWLKCFVNINSTRARIIGEKYTQKM